MIERGKKKEVMKELIEEMKKEYVYLQTKCYSDFTKFIFVI